MCVVSRSEQKLERGRLRGSSSLSCKTTSSRRARFKRSVCAPANEAVTHIPIEPEALPLGVFRQGSGVARYEPRSHAEAQRRNSTRPCAVHPDSAREGSGLESTAAQSSSQKGQVNQRHSIQGYWAMQISYCANSSGNEARMNSSKGEAFILVAVSIKWCTQHANRSSQRELSNFRNEISTRKYSANLFQVTRAKSISSSPPVLTYTHYCVCDVTDVVTRILNSRMNQKRTHMLNIIVFTRILTDSVKEN